MTTSRRTFLGASAAAFASAAALPAHAQTTSTQRALAADPLRPQFHLLPARNWMNDPNAPVFWKGRYHMFFQYNPHDAVWGDMHWAHAVSADMIHWQHRPIAIAPTPGGVDRDGVFSGTAFVQDGRLGVMYTAVRSPASDEAAWTGGGLRESQCIAFADDDTLNTFTKVAEPVIAEPPASLQTNGFRDPSPWQQDGWWYTPLASGIAGTGGCILLYRSKDLRTWDFVKIFAQRPTLAFEAYQPWDVWECPEFFALGDRHVLLYSTWGKVFWQSGRFDAATLTFHPEKEGIVDHGSFYAAKSQLDEHGNRILWGWVQEARPAAEHRAAGWAGMMSLPRVLTLAPDGTLLQAVSHAARTLRRNAQQATGADAEKITLKACCGEAGYMAPRGTERWRLEVRGSRETQPWFTLRYDPAHPTQIVAQDRPFELSTRGASKIGLHIDGSVIEVIIDDQVAWTKRFYYAGAQQDAHLMWTGNSAKLTGTWFAIEPISRDRLTT